MVSIDSMEHGGGLKGGNRKIWNNYSPFNTLAHCLESLVL